MRERTTLDTAAIWAGLVGASLMTITALITAAVYRGTEGQSFSPFNHWVSELGERGVSQLSWLFNGGLVIGGLLFVVFIVGLAVTRTGALRFVYGALGAIAGIAGAGVGVFPMNELGTHALVALTFFNLGWIVVGLASIDFWRRPDPRFPRWLSIIGLLTVIAFVGFLGSLAAEGLLTGDGLAAPKDRLDFWIVPTLEWALIVGILGWVFLTALSWLRAPR